MKNAIKKTTSEIRKDIKAITEAAGCNVTVKAVNGNGGAGVIVQIESIERNPLFVPYIKFRCQNKSKPGSHYCDPRKNAPGRTWLVLWAAELIQSIEKVIERHTANTVAFDYHVQFSYDNLRHWEKPFIYLLNKYSK